MGYHYDPTVIAENQELLEQIFQRCVLNGEEIVFEPPGNPALVRRQQYRYLQLLANCAEFPDAGYANLHSAVRVKTKGKGMDRYVAIVPVKSPKVEDIYHTVEERRQAMADDLAFIPLIDAFANSSRPETTITWPIGPNELPSQSRGYAERMHGLDVIDLDSDPAANTYTMRLRKPDSGMFDLLEGNSP